MAIVGKDDHMSERTAPICGHCDQAFDGRTKYCSPNCSNKASYARRAVAIRAAKRAETRARREAMVRVCEGCAGEIPATRTLLAKYCSEQCMRRHAQRDDPTRECSYVDCGRPVRARAVCSMHWKREARANGRVKRSTWDERRKANWAKRRALKKGAAAAEPIDNLTIFERDGWRCGLCHESVDRALVWPDPASPSLDHVVPLSRGGEHSPANVQLAHLHCNVAKGSSIAA